jgi:hypothetical protein
MWVVQTGDYNDVDTDVDVTPVVYLKAALGFLAIYNTPYTQEMVRYLLERQPSTSLGYYTGIDENGMVIVASRDTGNALIISAAKYAINNQVYPEASGTPSMVPASQNPTLGVPQATEPSSTPSNTPSPSAASADPTQVAPTSTLNPVPNPVHAQNVLYAAFASAVIGLLVIVSVWYLRKVKLSVFV